MSARTGDEAPAGPVAARPLPPTDPVARAVRAWFEAGHVAAGERVVVGCSGGADSLALAAAVMAHADRRPSPPPVAVVVDHGLQPGSATVADRAVGVLRGLGFETTAVRRVIVDGRGGTEAAARTARYAALQEAAAEFGASAVLLAHTADDQAETVLLGLARGSGPRSIAGMRPWTAPWGRPLLGVRRADTESACRVIDIEPWRDPHNVNPAFTRVRLRREVMPLLAEVLGGVVPALTRTAELMADDLDALDELADGALAGVRDTAGDVTCAALADWPSAVRRRALRTWVGQHFGVRELTYVHLVALERLVLHGRTRQSVRLPGGIDVQRRGGVITGRSVPDAGANGPEVGAATSATPDAAPPTVKWQAR